MKNKINFFAKITFWILYFVNLSAAIHLLFIREKVIKFWIRLEMELPGLTRLYSELGHIIFIVVIVTTLFIIIRETTKNKSVSLETISLSSVALFFLIVFFLISFILPMFKLAILVK